ncbi:MAG TPA: hypothetical protein VK669_05435 [Candidatus Limnocylindrales bacterium]|nr:hypothetical protein [Candidatus Limnocylindrales bacterium]
MLTLSMVACVIFLIVTICVVDAYFWNRGPQSLYRFFLLNGKLRLGGFVSTILAANLSLGNFLVFIATWGYQYGWAGLIWFVFNLILNVAGFWIFLRAFRPYIEDHQNNGTIHDYLSGAYAANEPNGRAASIRILASIVTVTGLLLAVGFELSIAVSLLQLDSTLERVAVFFLLTFVICLFTAFGGFRTLLVSDICQASLLTLATVVLFSIMLALSKNSMPGLIVGFPARHFLDIGWPSIVSICIIGFGWMLVAMDQWQRICASRSYTISLRGTGLYLAFITVFALIFAVWGMYDKTILLPLLHGASQKAHSGGSNPLADIPLLTSIGGPKLVVAFIVCGLIAAGLSTTNTFLTVSSHSLTTDVLVVSLANRRMKDLTAEESKAFVGIARAVIVGIGSFIVLIFAGLTASQLLTDPLSFFYIAYSIQFALLAPMFFTVVPRGRRPSSGAALLSLALGFAAALVIGFGSWLLLQRQASAILWIAPGDWLTLTPVMTLLLGLIPLAISYAVRGVHNASDAR